ncbi:MAG: DUF1304 domain-containing protein [Armatimonadetes bacterium]|nr:DUF1304 domain-containing protein [Armatimonadota bacterium]
MLAKIITLMIAVQHVYILYLEMFAWDKPLGRKIFRTTKEFAVESAALAKNQGLYNGFLAAGLFWSLTVPDPAMAVALQKFFLGCVAVAGVYGGLTAARNILFVQGLPAIVGLIVVSLL